MSWKDHATTEVGYRVERSTDPNFAVNVVDTNLPKDATSYDDAYDADHVGVGFYYRVRAYAGTPAAPVNSAWCNVASVSGGPVIVGFYGADTPGSEPNDGNKEMVIIGQWFQSHGYQQHTFNSLDQRHAFNWLLQVMDTNSDGKYDPVNGDQKRDIRIYGHSWGGVSAIKLSQQIESTAKFLDHSVHKLATIDPVRFGRFTLAHVHANVEHYKNWYQSHAPRVNSTNIMGVPVHGEPIFSDALENLPQEDLNPGGKSKSTKLVRLTDGKPLNLDHFTIIWEVEDALKDFIR